MKSPSRAQSNFSFAEQGDEPEDQITEERPPPSPTPMAVASSAQNEAALPTTEASAAAASKLRFPRFLRRTHSATYANARDVPPYALFLRTKRVSGPLYRNAITSGIRLI